MESTDCLKQHGLPPLPSNILRVSSCLIPVPEHSQTIIQPKPCRLKKIGSLGSKTDFPMNLLKSPNDQDQEQQPKNNSFSSPSFGDLGTPNILEWMDRDDTPVTVGIPPAQPSPEGGRNCTICFENPANTVFMPCGHGGICEECSLDVWKKNGNCPFCRDPISQC